MKRGTLPPVANTETWTDTIEFYDDADGSAFDLTNTTAITLKLRDIDSESPVLTGELDDEIVVVGDDADGTIQFTFSAASMAALDPKTYEAGILLTNSDGTVRQVLLGYLPVLKGL